MNKSTENVLLFSTLLFVSNIVLADTSTISDNQSYGKNKEACIIRVDNGKKYCLSIGESSGYALPSYIHQKQVYVNAPPGTAVVLSDYDNLSYNRLATFVGTVTNNQLKSVKAKNGEYIDFSEPRSMRVIKSKERLGCIIRIDNKQQYCLPVGKSSGYSLPSYIHQKQVYVNASPKTAVVLSDYDNLSYNRLATFIGFVKNKQLKYVKAANGHYIDFSAPRSMRVIAK